jgi:hypothetical protein
MPNPTYTEDFMARHEPFGKIIFHTQFNPLFNLPESITAEWTGPERVLISDELMKTANPLYWQRDGDLLTICQFKLRVIDYHDGLGLTVAERIR